MEPKRRGQCGHEHADANGDQSLHAAREGPGADRAVRREDGAIGSLVKPNTKLAFLFADEVGGVFGGHLGEMVNVLLAMRAETGAIIPGHVRPAGRARRGDADIGEQSGGGGVGKGSGLARDDARPTRVPGGGHADNAGRLAGAFGGELFREGGGVVAFGGELLGGGGAQILPMMTGGGLGFTKSRTAETASSQAW